MNSLAFFGVVTGDVNPLDFHEVEQSRAVRELGHIACRPKGDIHRSLLAKSRCHLHEQWADPSSGRIPYRSTWLNSLAQEPTAPNATVLRTPQCSTNANQ